MHKIWRSTGISQHRVEQLSSLRQDVAMRRSRVVPGKYGMSSLMLSLKEAEIKMEAIPVHMHHKQTEIRHLKYKDEIPAGTVHTVQINKTTILPLPTEE